jgi:dTDP-4-amino-4,6-dideoxygalactose transaminase
VNDLTEVPVARPRLPTADEILPFLRQIDTNQWYSNFGPLNERFQAGLSAHFGGPVVVCCSNATVGIAAALIAQEAPRGSLCAMPSWSFAASAHAVLMAGLVPWLVDVEATSQQLSAEAMHDYLGSAPAKVGAVMPVMPYGLPANLSAWDRFSDETGLAVVVDAAAAFDTLRPTRVPAVVSLHATKVLGTGEGGLVASVDGALMQRVGRVLNFGFLGTREATVVAMNGKLSEYGAAVGLAALADWATIRADFLRVCGAYRAALDGSRAVTLQAGFGREWVTSTCMVGLQQATAESTAGRLAAAGFATRRWWGGGLHRHVAFAGFPRVALPVTEALAESQLGLPCWRDLPEAAIHRIAALVAASGR